MSTGTVVANLNAKIMNNYANTWPSYTITTGTANTSGYIIGNLVSSTWAPASGSTWTPWTQGTIPQGTPLQGLGVPAAPPLRVAAPLGFNKYVNASDLLEEFIAFLGTEGVRKSEIMDLPVELFIKWLVIRACEVDQEEPGIVLALPAPRRQPRCLGCGKWMPRSAPVLLHGERCAALHFARVA